MKKILALLLVVILTATVSISGTLAFVQAFSSDEDTIVEGEVRIDQQIYYRNYISGEGMQTCTLEERQGTENDKGVTIHGAFNLYPAVYTGDKPDTDTYTATFLGDEALYTAPNIYDEIVVVKNTGKQDAYVRTWIAVESGSMTKENFEKYVTLKRSETTDWAWGNGEIKQIDGRSYYVLQATYKNALAVGKTTSPSLLQIMLNKEAGNAECAALDGSGDSSLDIRILSQAGWMDNSNATQTLSAMFPGDPWTGSSSTQTTVTYVGTAEQLREALKVGGEIRLGRDIHITDTDSTKSVYTIPTFFTVAKDTTINFNGYRIIVNRSDTTALSLFTIKNGVKLEAGGTGGILISSSDCAMFLVKDAGALDITSGTYQTNAYSTGDPDDIFACVYSNGGAINVYGGSFTFKNLDSGTNGGFNVGDAIGDKLSIVLHEGVLLSNPTFRQPDTANSKESQRIQLAQGCTLQETVIDDTTWWKVVKAATP